MRTTIRLNDQLLAEAKAYAAEQQRSLTSVIEDALRLLLAAKDKTPEEKPFKLVTFRGNGLQPGVNIDNNAALRDIMDGFDAPNCRNPS